MPNDSFKNSTKQLCPKLSECLSLFKTINKCTVVDLVEPIPFGSGSVPNYQPKLVTVGQHL